MKANPYTAHVWQLARAHGIILAQSPLSTLSADELARQQQSLGLDGLDAYVFEAIVGSCAYTGAGQPTVCVSAAMLDGETTVTHYVVALHELGHVISLHGHGEGPVAPKEIAAWQWALDHAHSWTLDCHRVLTAGIEQRLYHTHTHETMPEMINDYDRLFEQSVARIGKR